MSKFKLTKRFSLDFLGEDWKNAYIEFRQVGATELGRVMEAMPKDLDTKDTKEVKKAMDLTLNILKDHFVEGKGLGEEGELIEISKEDLGELPVDVINKAVSFLLPSSQQNN